MRLTVARKLAILDFDCEARATGYGDPNWVPQEVTAIAWSWIGDEKIVVCLRCNGARRMFERFQAAYARADVVTGHNLRRFDLPLLNAECLRLGLPSLGPKMVQDTLRDLVRTKGMKRDQSNLAKHFRLPVDKLALDWQDWQDAYADKGWAMVRERVVSDVAQNKLLREALLERDWLKEARLWTP